MPKGMNKLSATPCRREQKFANDFRAETLMYAIMTDITTLQQQEFREMSQG